MSYVIDQSTSQWNERNRPAKPGRTFAFVIAAVVCFVTGFYGAQAVAAERALAVQAFDLKSRHGVQATYQRLLHIAYQHCDLPIENTPNAQGQACVASVMDGLLNKIADPFLSYIHEYPEEAQLAQQ